MTANCASNLDCVFSVSSVFSVVKIALPHRSQLISRAVFVPMSTLFRPLDMSDYAADNGMRPAINPTKVCGKNGILSGSA